jgi:hypothetical protein
VEHVLLLVIHHILVDEWSLAVLIREFFHFYRAFVKGNTPSLPVPALGFSDYAHWEDHCLRFHLYDARMEDWIKVLKPPLSYLQFPWQAGASVGSNDLHSVSFEIPTHLCAALSLLARNERASLFLVLLSALKLLLHRQTGEVDIRISTNVARRQGQEFESLVGPLTDTLILRTQIGDSSPAAVLQGVRESFMQAYRPFDLPFENLAERLLYECLIPRFLLAQVFFLFHEQEDAPEAPELSVAINDATITLGDDFFKTAAHNYGVILYMSRAAGVLKGQMTVRTAVPEFAAGFVRDFLSTLEEFRGKDASLEVEQPRGACTN